MPTYRAGLYRVYWTMDTGGGCSLAAIGVKSNGENWIAPTNWVSTGDLLPQVDHIQRLERIEVDVDSHVEFDRSR